MKVLATPPHLFAWMTARSGYTPGPGFRAVHAEDASGRVVGMVGFDGWTPTAAWLHVALEAPHAARPLFRAALGYAFLQCGRQQLLGLVRESFAPLLAMARRVGFSEVARLPDAWTHGEALVMLRLHRDACRFFTPPKEAAHG